MTEPITRVYSFPSEFAIGSGFVVIALIMNKKGL
jgi:hypothetical protein